MVFCGEQFFTITVRVSFESNSELFYIEGNAIEGVWRIDCRFNVSDSKVEKWCYKSPSVLSSPFRGQLRVTRANITRTAVRFTNLQSGHIYWFIL